GELINRISVRGFEPYRLDQITIGLTILAPPVAAWLVQRGRPALAVIAAAAMAGTIGFLDDTTAKAALVASLPMIALLYWCPRPVARVAAGVWALSILTPPLPLQSLEPFPGLLPAAVPSKVPPGHGLLTGSFPADPTPDR